MNPNIRARYQVGVRETSPAFAVISSAIRRRRSSSSSSATVMVFPLFPPADFPFRAGPDPAAESSAPGSAGDDDAAVSSSGISSGTSFFLRRATDPPGHHAPGR